MPVSLWPVVPDYLYRYNNFGNGSDVLESQRAHSICNLMCQLVSISNNVESIFYKLNEDIESLAIRRKQISNRLGAISKAISKESSMEQNIDSSAFSDVKEWQLNITIGAPTVARKTIPKPIAVLYNECVPNPDVAIFDSFRTDSIKSVSLYSDPSFFFNSWMSSLKMQAEKTRGKKQERRAQRKEIKSSAGKPPKSEAESVSHKIAVSPISGSVKEPTEDTLQPLPTMASAKAKSKKADNLGESKKPVKSTKAKAKKKVTITKSKEEQHTTISDLYVSTSSKTAINSTTTDSTSVVGATRTSVTTKNASNTSNIAPPPGVAPPKAAHTSSKTSAKVNNKSIPHIESARKSNADGNSYDTSIKTFSDFSSIKDASTTDLKENMSGIYSQTVDTFEDSDKSLESDLESVNEELVITSEEELEDIYPDLKESIDSAEDLYQAFSVPAPLAPPPAPPAPSKAAPKPAALNPSTAAVPPPPPPQFEILEVKSSEPSAPVDAKKKAPIAVSSGTSDLLSSIKLGKQLKKVENVEKKVVDEFAGNDVASILARRIQLVGESDSEDDEDIDDDDWD